MTSPGPAVLALVIASILLSGCSAVGGETLSPNSPPTGAPEISVLELDVGDCLATTGLHSVTETVPVVDCTDEHESEAYARIALGGATFPGDQAIADRAVAECTSRFTAFVGVDYDASSLDFAYYYPTRSSWDRGDRDILCLVIDPAAESLTGSLGGAAR